MFFALVVLICIILVIIYHHREDLPDVGPREPLFLSVLAKYDRRGTRGEGAATFYSRAPITADWYRLLFVGIRKQKKRKKKKENKRKKIHSIVYSYVARVDWSNGYIVKSESYRRPAVGTLPK